MKNLFFALCATLMIAGLSSCKKEYTCHCHYNVFGTDTTYSETYPKMSKGDAETTCDARQTTLTVIDASASCELE